MADRAGAYLAAEQRLTEAVHTRSVCDFSDGQDSSTADEMGTWGAERTVRAEVIRQLLTEVPANSVQLYGAVIEGILDLRGTNPRNLLLSHCRIDALDTSDVTFTGETTFRRTTFTGVAVFDGATFTDVAWFLGATFTDVAWFGGATFTDDAVFNGATFTDDAVFNGATFTDDALFNSATFTGVASFENAIAAGYDFTRAQFHGTDLGPWIARKVTLNAAVLHARARVPVAALEISCRRLQSREGAHFVVKGGTADFEDAEFLRRTILASPGGPVIPSREDPGPRPEGFDALSAAERARWQAKSDAFTLARNLVELLYISAVPAIRLVSLRRASVGDLVVSGIGLEDCAFAGAHGLDKLRIDATCSFRRPPSWSWRTLRNPIKRRIVYEESKWRGWLAEPATAQARAVLPTPMEIAGIYRDLRKGLEDAKDEPGAADFYYGEMQMRRLPASRRHPMAQSGELFLRRPDIVERGLLTAYWAVSGYGLRAWRAIAALVVLLAVCTALFTLPAFAYLPAPEQRVSSVDLSTGEVRYEPATIRDYDDDVSLGTSLEFTARESLSLFRAPGTLVETTGIGTALDFALRLLAPLLLGLAVLAVRGRTKR